jgi:hypothetical protein
VQPKPRRNKEGKWTRFFVVKSGAPGKIEMREIDPEDPALADDPGVQGKGAGKLRIENDDQVWVVITTDETAHEIAERTFRDIVAVAQEHMIPHVQYKPDDAES